MLIFVVISVLMLNFTRNISNAFQLSSLNVHRYHNHRVVRSATSTNAALEVRKNDSMIETALQRALVGTHFALSTILLQYSCANMGTDSNAVGHVGLLLAASIVMGDFSTGVFHWAVDNYGSIRTPMFGQVCHAFQGHHEAPWTITQRSFVNNVYKITYGTIPALVLALLSPSHYVQFFGVLYVNWWLLSQEFHKYAHLRSVPIHLKVLQSAGIVISKKEHGLHHSAPFDSHYCILNGMCNPVLDRVKFFPWLERVVNKTTGNKPRNWSSHSPATPET